MAVLEALREEIERVSFSAFGENKRAVLFGTTDCREAAGQINRFVEQALGTRIETVLFVGMSLACVAGLMLTDGRKVFLKIHAGELDPAALRAVHEAQEMLRRAGIPAARLVLPATDFGNGKLASVHAFRDRGDKLRAYHKGAVKAAASGLAALIAAGRSLALSASIPELLAERPSPLAVKAPGIPDPPPIPPSDRATAVARSVVDDARAISGNEVLGHGDWASRNLRFQEGRISSIFDFEALRRGVEPILVGRAAIDFINEPSGVRDPAGAAARFVRDYEAEADVAFEGEDAVALDIGVALAVSRFCRSAVRSEGMRDEDAPRIFSNFMDRFRAALGRKYPQKAYF